MPTPPFLTKIIKRLGKQPEGADVIVPIEQTASDDNPPISESDLEEEIKEMVSRKVKEGFDTYEEIVECVTECIEDEHPEPPVRPIVERFARESLALHMKEQSTWSLPTDCDRLDKAFEDLEENGIVARQNFTCCQTCGHAEIGDEIQETFKSHPVIGYTFYHMQDTESAAEGGEVYLAYEAWEDGEDAQVGIGQKIVEILSKHGLKVIWDGSVKTRICISGLDWKRRRKVELLLVGDNK